VKSHIPLEKGVMSEDEVMIVNICNVDGILIHETDIVSVCRTEYGSQIVSPLNSERSARIILPGKLIFGQRKLLSSV
jgi:hypothetical protein